MFTFFEEVKMTNHQEEYFQQEKYQKELPEEPFDPDPEPPIKNDELDLPTDESLDVIDK